MERTIGIVILFQRRHCTGDLEQIVERFDHAEPTDDGVEISESGEADAPRIALCIETKPDRLAEVIAKVSRRAREPLRPAVARCDAMLVASWDRSEEVTDLSLEVCYLESRLKGILYYANIDEVTEGSFPPDAGVAALVPISDVALAQHLHGSWRLDPDTPCHVATPGRMAMTVTPSGDLVYSQATDDGIQRILLTYKVEDGDLITDQPSKPSESRSPIALGRDGHVHLRDLGGPCTFVRDTDPLDPDAALAALAGFALRHAVDCATPGGTTSPFVVIENAAGNRTLIRFADAAPNSATARTGAETAVANLREQGQATLCAFATDAILTIRGERVEAIVVEASRLDRTGAIVVALKYVAGDDGQTRADGPQLALPDAPRSWL